MLLEEYCQSYHYRIQTCTLKLLVTMSHDGEFLMTLKEEIKWKKTENVTVDRHSFIGGSVV